MTDLTTRELAALIAAGRLTLATISPRHPLRATLEAAVKKALPKPGSVIDVRI